MKTISASASDAWCRAQRGAVKGILLEVAWFPDHDIDEFLEQYTQEQIVCFLREYCRETAT